MEQVSSGQEQLTATRQPPYNPGALLPIKSGEGARRAHRIGMVALAVLVLSAVALAFRRVVDWSRVEEIAVGGG